MTNILVVDDDKLIRWSLKELLSEEGYTTEVVATTQEALRKAETSSYNLIFTDLEIEDENGIEMLKELQHLQKGAKIIILSALSRQQIEPQTENLSIFSIIEKPFESQYIRNITKEALSLENSENL